MVADHPERERNWLNLGRIFAEEQRNAEAVEAFGEAILLAAGEPARALEHLDMARRLAGPNFTFQAEYDAARRFAGVTQ